ncbi:helix-turn-helix domain-containing protein [Dissulfurirhabdus thermomarina]|uniref:helix-turn-helix domain-containing protein n=1 Tax=Dissulfurirhabdus thermomarina TaxID=1765737 RepID=UPI0015E88843|nr:helix-turn-helix domain-containing protein [Dissulfurirhabdus thermomarina]
MNARKRSRPYTLEDVNYVYDNYANMTAGEIAEQLGISKFQVAKIVSELRKKGVDLPEKTVRRQNPIEAFLKQRGIEPKARKKAPAKAAGRRGRPRKKSS